VALDGERLCSVAVIGGNVDGSRRSGKYARISHDGEKPSARFIRAGSYVVPLLFVGNISGPRWTRSPVAVEASSSRKMALGNGRRHAPFARSGLHVDGRPSVGRGGGGGAWLSGEPQPTSAASAV